MNLNYCSGTAAGMSEVIIINRSGCGYLGVASSPRIQ